ncbi:MAG: DNA polymerase III subunit delta [Anaerolineae bacterium]
MFYLFHGEDEFSRSETLAALKEKMGDPGLAELNTTVFDGSKVTLGELQHACGSVPFMADRRLVIVQGLLARLESKGEERALSAWQKEYLEGLTQYLRRLPETTRLVFVEDRPISEANPVHRLALADERGHVKEFEPPQGRALNRWIEERVRKKEGQIDPAAVETLAAFVGNDLRLLDQEIEKLIAYVDRARPISEDDVRLLVSYVREANIFEMVDALGQRDSQQAAKLLHQLLDEGEHPLALLGMIVRQFRTMIQVKELNAQGLSQQDIAAKLGLHRFVVKKAVRQAMNFSMEQLEAIYRKLLETDVAIKTGQMDEVLTLDMLVVELT